MAIIPTYFVLRRGRGRPRNIEHGWRPALAAVLCVWIFSFCLTCLAFSGFCGHFGYDAVYGRCHMICSQGLIIMAVGVGLPTLVVVVSYCLVYRELSKAREDVETENLQKSVLILTICYLVFIVPHSIFEWLLDNKTGLPNWHHP